jgi:hypothetical protein
MEDVYCYNLEYLYDLCKFIDIHYMFNACALKVNIEINSDLERENCTENFDMFVVLAK